MKRLYKISSVVVIALILSSGCGNKDAGRTIKNNNTVEAVLQNEIEKNIQDEAIVEETVEVAPLDIDSNQNLEMDLAEADTDVDVDISVMNKDMTYATVYQIMVNPESYMNKTIKIKGIHYSAFYEPTGLVYHYALIQDAAACCAQGIEFEVEEGYEYPLEEEEVIVTGTFDTYEEDGYLYGILRNSKIQ